MKTKVRIEEVVTHDEQGNVKKASNGTIFAKLKTSDRWDSCFEQNIIETLKLLKNHEVVLDIELSKDGKHKNIRGIYPDGEQEEESDYTDAVKRVDAQESKENVEKYSTSMYVSMCKDMVVAMIGNERANQQELVISQAMGHSIEAIKQAIKEFN